MSPSATKHAMTTALAVLALAGCGSHAPAGQSADRSVGSTERMAGNTPRELRADRSPGDKAEKLAKRFDKLDRNGDGSLDSSEFKNERAFARLDADNDGQVSRTEFVDRKGKGGKRAKRMAERNQAE